MHNNILSALLPLFFGLTNPLKNVEGLGPPSLIKENNERELRSNIFSQFIFCFSTCNCPC